MTPSDISSAGMPELPSAFEFVYEFPSPMGGVHRKMTPARWNGSSPSASFTVYTADQLRAYGRACIAQAAQDTVRLNWLMEHRDGFYNLDRITSIVGRGFCFAASDGWHSDIRGAIDHALPASPIQGATHD